MSWNYYQKNPYLRSVGIDCHTPDLGELQSTGEKRLVARCTSPQCAPRKNTSYHYGAGKRLEGLKRGVEDCPECGYAVVWNWERVRDDWFGQT